MLLRQSRIVRAASLMSPARLTDRRLRCVARACASAVTITAALLTALQAHAQTYTFTTVASFSGPNGWCPNGNLTIDGSGTIYGATYSGGPDGHGMIFRIAAGTDTLTTVESFPGNAGGYYPNTHLTIDASGNLYGFTARGGAEDNGTVFKFATATNTLTVIAQLTAAGADDGRNGKLAIDANGNLYGTTSGGRRGDGTVLKIAAGTGALTTLASFNFRNGSQPASGPIVDSRGNVFGTTAMGGKKTDARSTGSKPARTRSTRS